MKLTALACALAAGFMVMRPPAALASITGGGLDAASHAFDDAQYRMDVPAMRRMLDPKLVYISGAGKVGGVAEFLSAFSDPDVRFEPFRIMERRVLMLSRDVGVVTGQGLITGTNGGVPFRDRFQFSDTFAFRAGRWRPVYVQVTRLPD